MCISCSGQQSLFTFTVVYVYRGMCPFFAGLYRCVYPPSSVSTIVCTKCCLYLLSASTVCRGLLYCMEYLEDNLEEWFGSELEAYGAEDYLVFDCPGQVREAISVTSLHTCLSLHTSKP